MKISYEIHGVVLNEPELIKIHEYYEAVCTANYLLENYEIADELALQIGYEVRETMTDYNFSEDMAIIHVLPKYIDIRES